MSYYWHYLRVFGKQCYHTWRTELATFMLIAGIAWALTSREDPSAGTNLRIALDSAALVLIGFATVHFIRSAWLIHRRTIRQEQATEHWMAGVVGIAVIVGILIGGTFFIASLLIPRKHRYAISMNDPSYPGIANTVVTFRDLAAQSKDKRCFIRLTAPPENEQVLVILRDFAGVFCKVETPYSSAEPIEKILDGSVNDAIVVHMAKEGSSKEGSPRELTFMGDMGNVFSVRRKYELPPGSPDGLIWLQIGRGYPWRKDSGEAGTLN
jgi:uncharacterized membrane protein YidH (DUF202 family)